MTKRLIISRYDENLSWLNEYSDFNFSIYNKGAQLEGINKKYITELPNLGRESHTWIFHIIKNYENLDEYNIFLQGRIDDLGCMAFSNPNFYLKGMDKFGFAVSRLGLLTPFHWKNNVGIEKDVRYKKMWFSNEIGNSSNGFRNFAKSLFPEIPLFVATSYGGCFGVKKEAILKHDISFYEKILEILNKHKNPIEGHYMERLWCYIFTKNHLLKYSLLDIFKTKIERLNNNKNI